MLCAPDPCQVVICNRASVEGSVLDTLILVLLQLERVDHTCNVFTSGSAGSLSYSSRLGCSASEGWPKGNPVKASIGSGHCCSGGDSV
jgi:hypothetical protein